MRRVGIWLVLLMGMGMVYLKAEEGLLWINDLPKACAQAKEENRIVFLLFSGLDWCYWCQKFDEEILKDPGFIQKAGSFFVFVSIDFPYNQPLPKEVFLRNKKIQHLFEVEGFPTGILLDPKFVSFDDGELVGEPRKAIIATVGYLPMSGSEYGAYLEDIIRKYHSEKDFLSLDPAAQIKREGQWLDNLKNEFCVRRSFPGEEDKEKDQFSRLEHYELLLETKGTGDSEVQKLREEIEESDPHNSCHFHLCLALSQFQTLAKNPNENVEKIVEPLVDYAKKFGKKDRSNLWKIYRILSQFSLRRGRTDLALDYARQAYRTAPKNMRKEISSTILSLKHSSLSRRAH